MILVDTSVWVDHFRRSSSDLVRCLDNDVILTHPFVIGELALSGLINRGEILELLGALPPATLASHSEAIALVERWSLDGRGIGWVDTHLFASALLSGATLWTKDRRLASVASEASLLWPSA